MTPKIPTVYDFKNSIERAAMSRVMPENEVRAKEAAEEKATVSVFGTCEACNVSPAVMSDDNSLALCYVCLQGCCYEGEGANMVLVNKTLAQLATEFLDSEDPYTVGYSAFFTQSVDPYSLASDQATKWSAGWHQAEGDAREEALTTAQRIVEDAADKARSEHLIADAGKKISDRMALPIEMTGYELAQVFALWQQRYEEYILDNAGSHLDVSRRLGGLGPPRRIDESMDQFGTRLAVGALHFIKEI